MRMAASSQQTSFTDGRSPVVLPPEQHPVLPRSDADQRARGDIKHQREGKPCIINPEPLATLPADSTPCFRVAGAGNEVRYQPGMVDDAGSLVEDRYVVDGQTVRPTRATRLSFVPAALGWIPANLVGWTAFRLLRFLLGLLSRFLPPGKSRGDP